MRERPLNFLDGVTEDRTSKLLLASVTELLHQRSMQWSNDQAAVKYYLQLIDSISLWLNRRESVRWALFVGAPGSGKSIMAKAISNLFDFAVQQKGISFKWRGWCAFPRVLFLRASTVSADALADDSPWCLHPWVIIDDLGEESVNFRYFGNEIFPMVEILSRRYELQLTTIITSNLTAEEIKSRYGARMWSRCLEMVELFNFGSFDFRLPR